MTRAICLCFLFGVTILCASDFHSYPVWSDERATLTREYMQKHYGIDDFHLKNPSMIVVHYTASATLKEGFNAFRDANLPRSRSDVASGGRVNVGVHFLVDRDGTVYTLLPEDVAGRHAIGYNHVSFGIENVGRNASALTDAQVKANADIIAYLAKKYPSVKYLTGHHEYLDKTLPHYVCFRELDLSYRLKIKVDPGRRFMEKLRAALKAEFNLELLK